MSTAPHFSATSHTPSVPMMPPSHFQKTAQKGSTRRAAVTTFSESQSLALHHPPDVTLSSKEAWNNREWEPYPLAVFPLLICSPRPEDSGTLCACRFSTLGLAAAGHGVSEFTINKEPFLQKVAQSI